MYSYVVQIFPVLKLHLMKARRHNAFLIYSFIGLLEWSSIVDNQKENLDINNVPPSFRDAGAWEWGNAHWGCVETTPKF